MVMVFTLVTAAQDKLSEYLDFLKKEKERIELEKAEELERIEKVSSVVTLTWCSMVARSYLKGPLV